MGNFNSYANLLVAIISAILLAVAPIAVTLGIIYVLGGLAAISFVSALQWGLIALFLGLTLDRVVNIFARVGYFASGLQMFHGQVFRTIAALIFLATLYFFVTKNIWFALLASLVHAAGATTLIKIIAD
ncbi:hypothetical protein PQG65_06835 [Corynebacterium pseudodiphtheriticum]|uniref:hypothetical protein n=1 Tax=Corynebacterium pseudodiphtheriticum TaxID=37637 RepID=UPI000F8946BD|nr:hypothetical protein [Corynebacterium pseudodiphtheriticum]MDC7111088.1 hypothetical protein [Corynebacterium pseudodiphtheriticum]MDC7115105.1 hypothetical protein [Corynebacterium pseudodiphtheriticum]MDK4249912.1 hypothetical protein [Corynebacterium pseudodiphtheriticum]MDK4273432.1 hypothetical protein [Corynebacterium pseudodiphtheriticum]MDK4288072.1 hypothetical protein [Corynebacterium pseudodiphtheriticum]